MCIYYNYVCDCFSFNPVDDCHINKLVLYCMIVVNNKETISTVL